MKKGKMINTVLEYMIAVSFFMNVFANVVSFYLTGNKNDMVRTIISWSIMVLIVLCLISYIVYKFFSCKTYNVKKNIFISLLPAVGGGILLIIALIYRKGDWIVLQKCASYFVYCVPMVCGAVYMVLENKIEEVVFKFKKVTLFMLPYFLGAIIYFWNLNIESYAGDEYGSIVYLSIGYTGITIYSFLLCDVFLNNAKNSKSDKWSFVTGVEILVASLIIIMSGSRGTLLSWFFINIFVVIILFIRKQKKSLWTVGISVAGIISFCIIAPSDNIAIDRQLGFINEIRQGTLRQSMTSEESRKLLAQMAEQGGLEAASDILKDINASQTVSQKEGIDESINNEKDNSVVNQAEADSPAMSQPETDDSAVSQSEFQDYVDTVRSVTNGSMARSYLWQLAFKEVKEKPFCGMGIMGYQIKYGTYPHNILLESMVDFGIPLFIVFLVVCFILFIFYLKNSMRDWTWACITVYLSGQAVGYMLSGDLYSSGALLLAITLFLIKKCDNWKWLGKEISKSVSN